MLAAAANAPASSRWRAARPETADPPCARAARHAHKKRLVHQQTRHGVGIELDDPSLIRAGRIRYVRHHELRRRRVIARRRLRIERADFGDHIGEIFGIDATDRRQAAAVRAAPATRDCRAMPAIAGSSRSRSASCAARHSFRSRANSPTGSKRIMRARTDSTRSSGIAIASAIAAGSAVSRPAGHSNAIRCAPIMRSTGSLNDSRSCSPRWSRSGRRSSATSSMPRSSASKSLAPPWPLMCRDRPARHPLRRRRRRSRQDRHRAARPPRWAMCPPVPIALHRRFR